MAKKLFIYLGVLLFTSMSWSLSYYIPYTGQANDEVVLIAQNNSSVPLTFWLQHRHSASGKLIEDSFFLRGQEKLSLFLHRKTAPSIWAVVTLAFQSSPRVSFKLKTAGRTHDLLPHTANGYKISKNKQIKKVFIANTSAMGNDIRMYDGKNRLLKKITIKPHGSYWLNHSSLKENLHKVTSSYPSLMSTYASTTNTQEGNVYKNVSPPSYHWDWQHKPIRRPLSPDPRHHYFLIGRQNQPSSQETFVIPMDDPALIEEARYLINHPEVQWGRIISARIALGHGGFNRHFKASQQPVWSWHVNQVTSLGDFGSQFCDGSPTQVELLAQEWVDNIGIICFWNFTFIRELKPKELSLKNQ